MPINRRKKTECIGRNYALLLERDGIGAESVVKNGFIEVLDNGKALFC